MKKMINLFKSASSSVKVLGLRFKKRTDLNVWKVFESGQIDGSTISKRASRAKYPITRRKPN
jgi:hypothetical protein